MRHRLFMVGGLLLALGAQGQSFQMRAVNLEAAVFSALALGDLDQDGDLDVVVAGVEGQDDVTRVYLNAGNGTQYTAVAAELAGVVGAALSLNDYDSDGDLDLLISGEEESLFYRNEGGEPLAFSLTAISFPGVARLSGALEVINTPPIAWADYDNDGDQDLVVAWQNAPDSLTTLLIRNQGEGGFFPIENALPALTNNTMAWGDYDQDGDQDLVLASRPSVQDPLAPHAPFTRIFRNDPDRTFVEIGASLPGLEVGSVEWGDYDQDGDLDLLVVGSAAADTPAVGIYQNQGNDQFVRLSAGLPAAWHGRWADFDNDGDLDVLLATGDQAMPTLHVIRNDGGVFSTTGTVLEGVWWGAIGLGDMDGDGDLDILAMGDVAPGRTEVRYYENAQPTPNQVPSPPPILNGEIIEGQQGSLVLSWLPGADAETTEAGLMYNLRVGTAPGDNDIFSASAHADGTRMVPAAGNVGHALTWTLTLTDTRGIYYAAVQTIDAGWRGSAFVEQEIVVATRREETEPPSSAERLWPGYPNPFSKQTTLRYSLMRPSQIQIDIFDLQGRLIAKPFSGQQAAGDFAVTWSGRNTAGQRVAAGVYLVRFVSEQASVTQRLVFLP